MSLLEVTSEEESHVSIAKCLVPIILQKPLQQPPSETPRYKEELPTYHASHPALVITAKPSICIV